MSIRRSVVSVMLLALIAVGTTGVSAASSAGSPTATARPNRAAPGDQVLIEGAGFSGDCDVLLTWGSADGEPLAVAPVDGAGAFSAAVTIPAHARHGVTGITARGRVFGIAGCGDVSGMTASASVTVDGPGLTPFSRRIQLLGRTLDDPGIHRPTLARTSNAAFATHAIVQLESLPTPGDVDTLAELGVGLLSYINAPDGIGTAYLAALAPGLQHQHPRFRELVRGVQPLQASDKIDPRLQGATATDVYIASFPGVSNTRAQQAMARHGVAAKRAGHGLWRAAQVSQGQVAGIATEDGVQYVMPVPVEGQLDLDRSRTLHNVDPVHRFSVPAATYLGRSGLGVQVGIHDSGIDVNHRDFENRLLNTPPTPGSDHGTHVASIAAGSGLMSDQDNDNGVNNGGTAWQYRGTAPQSGIAGYGSQTGHDTATMSDAINTRGVDVSNHSYSYNDGQYDATMVAIDTIIRGDSPGIPARPQVFSAGNQGTAPQFGQNSGYFSLSKSCKNCIIVANLQANGVLNGGSSHGPTPDGRLKPNLGAMGTGVIAAVGASTNTGPPANELNIGNNYVSKGGTSMAAPAVTGVVALLLQEYAAEFGVNLDTSPPRPSTVKAILLQTAADLAGQASGTNPDTGAGTFYGAGPDWGTGYGVVDAQAGIDLVRNRLFRERTLSETTPTREHLVGVVPGQDELRVTIAWDDRPGTPNTDHSTPQLVNDLDLILIGPNGEVHRPLVLPPATQFDCDTTTGGIQTGCASPGADPGPWPANQNDRVAVEGTDRLNNVEQVVVANPAPGTWRARVSVLNTDTTIRLPLGGTQPYSIAGVTDARADLSITKTATPNPAIAGNHLRYEVTATNHGPDPAVDVTVVDQLPSGVAYLADTDSCVQGPTGTLTCSLGNLAAGSSRSFQINVAVAPNLVVGTGGATTIFNTATAYSAVPDPNPDNNQVTVGTFVEDLADLSLGKLCKPDDRVSADEEITCTIVVDNLGPSHARSVVVTDKVLSDGAFTIHSASSTQGSCGISGGTVTCTIGTQAAGARVTVTVTLSAQESMDINNLATVSSATPDPDLSNNEDEDHVSVVAEADLSITTSDSPDPVVAGESLTYTLEIANAGPSTASNVIAWDIVPSGVTVTSVTGTGGASCTVGVAGDPSQPTNCAFGSLPAGGSRTMTIEVGVHPRTTGSLANNAWVSSDTRDPNNANNEAHATTTVHTIANLRVGVNDLPDPVRAGNVLSWDLRVDNDGPSTARQVNLRHALPNEATFLGAVVVEGTGTCVLLENPPNTVSCDHGDLDPGAFVRVTITARVASGTPHGTVIEATSAVASPTTDPAPANNTVVTPTTVLTQADLGIVKTSDKDVYSSSDWIVYTVRVTNRGPSDAQSVVVVDTLPLSPSQIVYRFDTGGCVYSRATHVLRCALGTLAAGQTTSFNIHVSTKGNPGKFTNVVEVSSDTVDPNPANNVGTREVRVGKGGDGGGGKKSSVEPVAA